MFKSKKHNGSVDHILTSQPNLKNGLNNNMENGYGNYYGNNGENEYDLDVDDFSKTELKKTVLMGDSLFDTRKTESLHELRINSVKHNGTLSNLLELSDDNLTVSSSNIDNIGNIRDSVRKSKSKKKKPGKTGSLFRFNKRNAYRPSIEKIAVNSGDKSNKWSSRNGYVS